MSDKLALNCNSVPTDTMTVTAEKEAFHFMCEQDDYNTEIIVLRKDADKLIKFLQEH